MILECDQREKVYNLHSYNTTTNNSNNYSNFVTRFRSLGQLHKNVARHFWALNRIAMTSLNRWLVAPANDHNWVKYISHFGELLNAIANIARANMTINIDRIGIVPKIRIAPTKLLIRSWPRYWRNDWKSNWQTETSTYSSSSRDFSVAEEGQVRPISPWIGNAGIHSNTGWSCDENRAGVRTIADVIAGDIRFSSEL